MNIRDVNPGQIKLIEHFVNDGVKLWVVGDDDQTLYAFRASDVRYVLEFSTTHPGAQIHVLDRNYRSCPEIVLAAKRLIRRNRIRIDKDYPADYHRTRRSRDQRVSIARNRGEASGARHRRVDKSGEAAESIAVLYRTSTIGLYFQSALKDMGILFEVRGGADLWQSVAAKLVVGALTYLRDGKQQMP